MSALEDCYCNTCNKFADVLDGVDELLRQHSGRPETGRSLTIARDAIERAWADSQTFRRHVFVADPDTDDESDEEEEAEQSARNRPVARTTNMNSHTTSSTAPTAAVQSSRTTGDAPHDSAYDSDEYEYDDKFNVCDHCMAHALPCTEAAVCDQCVLYEQPCVHRWCQLSPNSIEDCPRESCRYAHRDTVDQDSNWIVMQGRLPRYISRGRLGPRDFRDFGGATSSRQITRRQIDGLAELRTEAERDQTGLDETYLGCACYAQAERDDSEEDDNYTWPELCSQCPRESTHSADPCGHEFCRRCAESLGGSCPICYRWVNDIIRLYWKKPIEVIGSAFHS